MSKLNYSLIIRYLMLPSLTLLLGSCGAQMYQVSLEEDHDAAKIPKYSKNKDSQYYGLHAVDGWQSLPIRFKTGSSMNPSQLKGLNQCIKIWEDAVGKDLLQYVGADSKTGDSFSDLYSSLADSTNGHYLDSNWDKTGKSEMVLATTIWDTYGNNSEQILTADIRFNTQHYLVGDSFSLQPKSGEQKEVVDMETLCLHELGHKLGLTHVDKSYDRLSIMNPTIYIGEGLANRSISCGDIKRIQKIYGCSGEACDQEAMCRKLEQSSEIDE